MCIDRQLYRPIDRQTETTKQIDRRTVRHKESQIDRQTDRYADRQKKWKHAVWKRETEKRNQLKLE